MFYAGLIVGLIFLGGFFFQNARKLLRYLRYAKEASTALYRAVALSLVVLALMPIGAVFVPVPTRVQAAAMVGREVEQVMRVSSAGFLHRTIVKPGRVVKREDLLGRVDKRQCA